MFERFTRNARAVVVDAQSIAVRVGAPEVRPAHLFESLAATDGGLAMQVLAQLGAPAEQAQATRSLRERGTRLKPRRARARLALRAARRW